MTKPFFQASGYNANHVLKEQPARTPLHIAAGKGFLSCVHVLIQSGAQVDIMDKNLQTPLMQASAKGHVDVVRYLTRVGADSTLKCEDGKTSLHVAAKAGHLEVCKLLINQARRPKLLIGKSLEKNAIFFFEKLLYQEFQIDILVG